MGAFDKFKKLLGLNEVSSKQTAFLKHFSTPQSASATKIVANHIEIAWAAVMKQQPTNLQDAAGIFFSELEIILRHSGHNVGTGMGSVLQITGGLTVPGVVILVPSGGLVPVCLTLKNSHTSNGTEIKILDEDLLKFDVRHGGYLSAQLATAVAHALTSPLKP